jgi:hypothetical protein
MNQDMDKVSLYVRLKEQTPMINSQHSNSLLDDETMSAAARKSAINKAQMVGI